MSRSLTNSSGVKLGPALRPMGLRMFRKYSTWAPFTSRVRSPIQRKCLWGLGQRPVVFSCLPLRAKFSTSLRRMHALL